MSPLRTLLIMIMSLAVAVALALAAGAVPASGAIGEGPTFGPSAPLATELHVTLSHANDFGGRDVVTMHWRRERLRLIAAAGMPTERSVTDVARGTEVFGWFHDGVVHGVSTTRNVATVAPDGRIMMDDDLLAMAWPLVTRVRSGGTALTATTVGGRAVFRGITRLAANECAGLRAGARSVDLNPHTLVPVRIVERRAGRLTLDAHVGFRSPRTSDFTPLTVRGTGFGVTDLGYVRRTPAQAAALLDFDVSLPTALPAGFQLETTGSATQGAFLGPEASFPRSRGLFFASWRRGLEPLQLTIRGARSPLTRDWDQSDPFGAECGSTTSTNVAVGTVTGKYAAPESGPAYLWWRNGTTLYTLTGPFSSAQLVAVAESLSPVAG